MTWIIRNIHRVMLVSGILTLTMVYAALAPEAALQSNFGESLDGPVADLVVRNWGALIGLMGAMLIYAANKPDLRPLALAVAGASKAIFIALVLSHGSRFLAYQAGVAIIVDLVWVVVFAMYLLAARRARVPAVRERRTVGVP
jgi:cbb3-type cytochrome oxidase subunit 1